MDYTLSGSVLLYVLVLMLLDWRPVSAAPSCSPPPPGSCVQELELTKKLVEALKYDTKQLLDEYIKSHGNRSDPVPGDVPAATVCGATLPEKLQDVLTKNQLFHLHLSTVERYQDGSLLDSPEVLEALCPVKERLAHNADRIKAALKHVYCQTPVTTTTPPPPSHSDMYERKVYGWGVIVRLDEWLTNELQVLQEAENQCGTNTQ